MEKVCEMKQKIDELEAKVEKLEYKIKEYYKQEEKLYKEFKSKELSDEEVAKLSEEDITEEENGWYLIEVYEAYMDDINCNDQEVLLLREEQEKLEKELLPLLDEYNREE